MIHLNDDNWIFYYSACPALRAVYIYKKKKSGPSSLNTQTHAIQINFSPHDKDFRAKYFGHEIHAGEIDTCCFGEKVLQNIAA